MRKIGQGPRSKPPGAREGGAGLSLPWRDARKCRGVCPIPQPAFPLSLPPSPHPSPPLRLFPPSLGRHLPESPFLFCFVLELASRLSLGGAASAGEVQAGAPAGQSGGRSDKSPASPSTHRSSLGKLLLSVWGTRGVGDRGRESRAPGRISARATSGLGSLDSDQGQLQAHKQLRN